MLSIKTRRAKLLPEGKAIGIGAWLIVVLLGLYHFVVVCRTAVNVPFWDEWEAFQGQELLPHELSWSWLITQHNEHRILFTRLQTWLLLRLNNWNVADQIRMNFAIFCGLVAVVIALVKKAAPQLPQWLLAFCASTQLSDLPIENHAWGFQSQFHVTLLALLGAVWLLFAARPSLIRLTCGVLTLFLAMFSFSAGLSGSVMVVLGFIILRWLLWRTGAGYSTQSEVTITLAFITVWALGLSYYFHQYIAVGGHPDPVLPYRLDFWRHYSNLIALGYGYTRVSDLSAVLCLALTLIPLASLLFPMVWGATRHKLDVAGCRLAFSGLVVLMALATISLGRAGFDVSNAKSSRYAEIAMLLVPVTVGLLYTNELKRWRLQPRLVKAICLTSVVGLANNWNFWPEYKKISEDRQAGVDCIQKVLIHGGDGSCPTIYPSPIADRIKTAAHLRASFVNVGP